MNNSYYLPEVYQYNESVIGIEYIDNNGNKYQKHKWKMGAKIEKVN